MTFDEIAQALHLTAAHDVWRAGFAASQRSFAPDQLGLRDDEAFASACQKAGLSDEVIGVLRDSIPALLSNEPLLRLVWHCHRRIFILGQHDEHDMGHWPMPPNSAGDLGRLFYAFVYLSGLPRVLAYHEQKGIPPEITPATLSDIELWMREYRGRSGHWGLDQPWWPSTYFTGRLYALGRLQFEMERFALPFRVYRSNRHGRVVAMVEAGQRMGSRGQFADAFGGRDAGEIWTTTLAETDDRLTGHPASARGEVHRDRTVTLDRREWSEVLRPGDPTLVVHIPATSPLTDEACNDAFSQAMTFFPRHFPEHESKAFWTMSWMLDPQLADHLPAESNLVQFLRRFHLLPIPRADDAQTRERVFGVDRDKPVDQLPQKTTLQRAIVQHMRHGGRWRMTGGFILPEGG